jgi:hypothetical protein
MIVAALTLSVAVSAFFGVLQVLAGGLLVRRLVMGWRWRVRSVTIGALAGVWLLVGGIGECTAAVGTTLRGEGAPTAPLRAAIDGTIVVTTLVLVVALVAYLIWVRLAPPPNEAD